MRSKEKEVGDVKVIGINPTNHFLKNYEQSKTTIKMRQREGV